MKALHRFTALALVVLLTGCASSTLKPDSAADVENRTGSDSSGSSSGTDKYPTINAESEKRGDLKALQDPNSPLAKRSIYYDYDSFIIKDTYKPTLEAHADFLQKNKSVKLIIQGNTDERGSREYNLALGQKRAEGVRQAMKLLGVSDNQIEAVSFGEEKPKSTDSSEAGWAENRRSDLAYEGE